MPAAALRAPDRSREGKTRAGIAAVSPIREICQEQWVSADRHSAGVGPFDPNRRRPGLSSAPFGWTAQRSAGGDE
jgi:hypothetical protein